MSPEEKEDLLHRLRFFDTPYAYCWDDIKWKYRGETNVSDGGKPSFFRFTLNKGTSGKLHEWKPRAITAPVLDPDLIAVLKMAAFPTIIDTEE